MSARGSGPSNNPTQELPTCKHLEQVTDFLYTLWAVSRFIFRRSRTCHLLFVNDGTETQGKKLTVHMQESSFIAALNSKQETETSSVQRLRSSKDFCLLIAEGFSFSQLAVVAPLQLPA